MSAEKRTVSGQSNDGFTSVGLCGRLALLLPQSGTSCAGIFIMSSPKLIANAVENIFYSSALLVSRICSWAANGAMSAYSSPAIAPNLPEFTCCFMDEKENFIF